MYLLGRITLFDMLIFIQAHNGFNTKTSELLERAMNGDLNTPPRSTLEELFLPYLKRFLAIDHGRGVQVLKKWQEWFQKKDMKSELTFATLDEYLENRCMDMGILYVSESFS